MSNPPLRTPSSPPAPRCNLLSKREGGKNGGTRLEQPWASAKLSLALCAYSWACFPFILLTLSLSSSLLFSVKCFSSWPGLTEGCVCVYGGVRALVEVVTGPTPAASCPLQPTMTECKPRKREREISIHRILRITYIHNYICPVFTHWLCFK